MEMTEEIKTSKDLFDVNLREIWKKWELRAMVLFTLGVQIVLLLLGNRRKSCPKVWLRVLVWCAYLTSDYVATVALGVLSRKLGEVNEQSGYLDDNSKLVALWAPLLLLLLGGPDTITAYSLEDNALWLRHLLALGVQAGATAYVLFMAWTSSSLSVLSLVMILVGLIKYGERTWVRWLASKDKLRESMLSPPDPSPNYPRFMAEYSLKQAEGYHVTADEVIEVQVPAGLYATGDLSNINYAQKTKRGIPVHLIIKAYGLLQIFKCLFIDLILSYDDRDLSRSIFKGIPWNDAFQLIEIELGFMYDLLYTKAMLLYSVWGFRRRFITFSLTLLVLAFFSLIEKYPECSTKKEKYAECSTVDLYITYALLLPKQPRWSNSIAQFSLLEFCINENPLVCHGILKRLNINEKLDKYHYTAFEKVQPELKKMIFERVKVKYDDRMKMKSDKLEMPTDPGQIGTVLDGYEHKDEIWSTEAEFDQIILTWHIATELCYYSDNVREFTEYRLSKLLSRYMFYLLVRYPSTLPNGIGQIRIRDTFAEAIKFFEEQAHSNPKRGESHGASSNEVVRRSRRALKSACDMLLKVNTEVPPTKVKGGRSKSVLFDGCQLATALNKVERTKKWKMIGHLWVEVLLFAASQSRGDCHADQLRRGGELLTHVWLLLAHFGLTDHFKMTQGHAIAKLILR
ncbi:hypothetical protein EUGRSUZ_F02463 [Eucalyptus grandis]|uniref:DUF4220 domain-containing protein n=3 Tax=Eucalyptus grandis TaxID=71139 RepID=A0A059BRI1_EUCGR|nr:hypothetical protein EUGRSUZ_F02463 [Eucalyptus grandis]KAK3425903.1 hypothetical protein EUGRSUZ_F02463 [Eucalyptus grandis]